MSEEIPGLLERLDEVPDPRDLRGVRHDLVAALALIACAVLAGATSLLAVGEWISDAPPFVLKRLGVRPDSLFPKRSRPVETAVRRLLGRIDATRWSRQYKRRRVAGKTGRCGKRDLYAVTSLTAGQPTPAGLAGRMHG
ncbi:transposase family protein [Streptomyces gamaensis]|uniref:Transposase family protein n=1 Tax=Streptomyces gamaensis TaxID=1763542 RepID=A0ABW0Z226_9ACTN